MKDFMIWGSTCISGHTGMHDRYIYNIYCSAIHIYLLDILYDMKSYRFMIASYDIFIVLIQATEMPGHDWLYLQDTSGIDPAPGCLCRSLLGNPEAQRCREGTACRLDR